MKTALLAIIDQGATGAGERGSSPRARARSAPLGARLKWRRACGN